MNKLHLIAATLLFTCSLSHSLRADFADEALEAVAGFVTDKGGDALRYVADHAGDAVSTAKDFLFNQGKDAAIQAGNFIAEQGQAIGQELYHQGENILPQIGDFVSTTTNQIGNFLVTDGKEYVQVAGNAIYDAAKTAGEFIAGPVYHEVANFVTGGSNFEKAKDFLTNQTQTVLHSDTVQGLQEELQAGGLQLVQTAPTLWQRAKSLVTSGYDTASTFLTEAAKHNTSGQTAITSVKPVKIQSTTGSTATISPTLYLIEFIAKQLLQKPVQTAAATVNTGISVAKPVIQQAETTKKTIVVTKEILNKLKTLTPAEQNKFLLTIIEQQATVK